jgi:hypothetical protein
MKKEIEKNILAVLALLVLLVGCSVIEKGVVISKEIIPSQNKKSIQFIGKVMVPSTRTIEKQFLILVKVYEREKLILTDSSTYSKIQVNDTILIERRKITKH